MRAVTIACLAFAAFADPDVDQNQWFGKATGKFLEGSAMPAHHAPATPSSAAVPQAPALPRGVAAPQVPAWHGLGEKEAPAWHRVAGAMAATAAVLPSPAFAANANDFGGYTIPIVGCLGLAAFIAWLSTPVAE